MKKKAIILVCLTTLFLLLPDLPAAADEKLTFISINDTLPPELINCVTNYGGVTYVPYFIFSDYGLGISYSYFTSAATAYLSTKDKQLFFELNSGETYDGDDNHYSTPGIIRGGTVYLPLGLMCRYFGGISYSNIAGNEYGNILRITTDAVILTDAEFLRAARNSMRTSYRDYIREQETATTPLPAATAPVVVSPTPAVMPTPEQVESHEGDEVALCFVGLPSERILTQLSQGHLKACFFLTAEDVRADPDLVRRLAGEGHSLGMYCDREPDEAFPEITELLFESARVRPILITSTVSWAEDCAALAAREGLLWNVADYSTVSAEEEAISPYLLTARLEELTGNLTLRLGCDPDNALALNLLLTYLRTQRYSIICPRETP